MSAKNCDVTFFEGGRAMHRYIVMALLESPVLVDVMQKNVADDDCALHHRGNDHALQDPAANAHVPAEGPLLVNNVVLLGIFWGLDGKTNDTPIMRYFLGLLAQDALGATENSILLLEGLLHLLHGASECFC